MKIKFLGGDKRMRYAADALSACYDIAKSDEKADVVVLPLPLTKNGKDLFAPNSPQPIPIEEVAFHTGEKTIILAGGECDLLTSLCKAHSLKLVNYFQSETLTLKNAALTAENACMLLMENTNGALLSANVLITGFGRIAKELAKRFSSFGCRCTIAARRREARCEAELCGFRAIPAENPDCTAFDFVINTVPAALFSEETFAAMPKSCVFLELATLPESLTRPLAEKNGIRYIYGSGLPGKYSPKAAGAFIAQEIQRLLNFDRKD